MPKCSVLNLKTTAGVELNNFTHKVDKFDRSAKHEVDQSHIWRHPTDRFTDGDIRCENKPIDVS